MNKITAQVGQIIEVNGKSYRATADGFEPVVQRGPLGGELKTWEQLQPGEKGFLHVTKGMFNQNLDEQAFERFKETVEKAQIETNIPPLPTFTPMTAGEAAQLPDIVGRWVAVKVDQRYAGKIESQDHQFDDDDKILLIEGVDL